MENRWDFIEWLGPDTSTCVFMCLDDPADFVRVSFVSRSWRRFIITNGFCKKLCLRMCPEVSIFTHVVSSGSTEPTEVGSSTAMEWGSLEREHKAYTYISHRLVLPKSESNCIHQAICASSTDNHPDESIEHTLVPSDGAVVGRPSYWSSKGSKDPEVPEILTYRLSSNLCVINEIKIQPFKAFFQHGYPIYSANAVRFRMGHSRIPQETEMDISDEYATAQRLTDNDYIWTYVSSEFPMVQENALQTFKLPRPVVCIGGILQIELLGRVQKQEMDGLYYICVCHVQAFGYPLSPVLDVDIRGAAGNPVLKYFPDAKDSNPPEGASEDDARETSGWHAFAARIRQIGEARGWNHVIMNTLLGAIPVAGVIPVAAEDNSSDEEPDA